MENEQDTQCSTAKCKGALVLGIPKGETSIQEAARTYGLTMRELEDWKDKFLLGAENVLRCTGSDLI